MPDHARIARRFYASRHTYLNEARVQRTMADSLLSLLADKHICFDKVLELGCGSGLFSRELIKQLSDNPYLYPPYDDPNLPPDIYRKAVLGKWYKVVYSVEDNCVYVDAVVDGRMQE